MKDSYRIGTLVFAGFLTLIMTSVFPVEGGGAVMIFMISVPFLIVLGVVFAWIYRLISKRVADTDIKGIVFSLLLFF